MIYCIYTSNVRNTWCYFVLDTYLHCYNPQTLTRFASRKINSQLITGYYILFFQVPENDSQTNSLLLEYLGIFSLFIVAFKQSVKEKRTRHLEYHGVFSFFIVAFQQSVRKKNKNFLFFKCFIIIPLDVTIAMYTGNKKKVK